MKSHKPHRLNHKNLISAMNAIELNTAEGRSFSPEHIANVLPVLQPTATKQIDNVQATEQHARKKGAKKHISNLHKYVSVLPSNHQMPSSSTERFAVKPLPILCKTN